MGKTYTEQSKRNNWTLGAAGGLRDLIRQRGPDCHTRRRARDALFASRSSELGELTAYLKVTVARDAFESSGTAVERERARTAGEMLSRTAPNGIDFGAVTRCARAHGRRHRPLLATPI